MATKGVVNHNCFTVVRNGHVAESLATEAVTQERLRRIENAVAALAKSDAIKMSIESAIDAFVTATVVGHIYATLADTNEHNKAELERRVNVAEAALKAAEAIREFRLALEANSSYPRTPTRRYPRGAASEPGCLAETLRIYLGIDRHARPRAYRRVHEAIPALRRSERNLAQWSANIASSRKHLASTNKNVGKKGVRSFIFELAKAWVCVTGTIPPSGQNQTGPFGQFAAEMAGLNGNDSSRVIRHALKYLGATPQARADALAQLSATGYQFPFGDDEHKRRTDPC